MNQNGWQMRLIQLLAVPGLLLAYYLLLFHNGDLVAGCSSSGWDDCGLVSGPDGRFSAIGPVPVALIGLLAPTMLAGPGCCAIGHYLPLPRSKRSGRPVVVLE